MPTAPELFAMARGKRCQGSRRCFFCGAPAGEEHATSAWVLPGFTAYSSVAASGSKWVCVGCTLILSNQEIPGYGGEQWSREFSWLVTPADAAPYLTAAMVAVPDRLKNAATEKKQAYRQEQLSAVRSICLQPPEPPFALVVTVGGRTHQLYRGVVCHSLSECVLTLEGERIDYRPADLRARLQLLARLVAAVGKQPLDEPLSGKLVILLQNHHGPAAVDLIRAWENCHGQPLSRLALFLSPNREECAREYPAIAAPGGADAGRVRRGRKSAR